jgi:hypothetical protein
MVDGCFVRPPSRCIRQFCQTLTEDIEVLEGLQGLRFLMYSARVMANLERLLSTNPLPIITENNFQKVCRETERQHWESGESAQDCARSIYPLLTPFALD